MRKINYTLMYERVYAKRRLARALLVLERVAVGAVVLTYLASLVLAAVFDSLLAAAELAAVAAVPFLAVTLMRRWIGSKRPYEVYDLAALGIAPPREGGGDSFPSRHTASAFVIGTLLCLPSPAVGGAVLLLGVYIAAARVLLGFHFIRDVLAGALLGVVMGAIGIAAIVLI